MNYIIIENYLLEDLGNILLRSGYSYLVEKIDEDKIKITFLGGNNGKN